MNLFRKLIYRIHFAWCSIVTAVATVVCSSGFALTGVVSRTPGLFRWWGSLWGKGMLSACGIFVRTRQLATLEKHATYVFVANHQNSVDIPAVLSGIPHSFGFVAKAQLENTPFLGWALKLSPSVFVDSKNARRSRESMEIAANQVAAGSSVLVFPEGRRSWSASMGSFKRSAFALAAGAGVPVVPVAILNAHALFDERHYLSRPGVVDIVIGNPMNPGGKERSDIDDLSRRARDEIMSLIADAESTPSITESIGQSGR